MAGFGPTEHKDAWCFLGVFLGVLCAVYRLPRNRAVMSSPHPWNTTTITTRPLLFCGVCSTGFVLPHKGKLTKVAPEFSCPLCNFQASSQVIKLSNYRQIIKLSYDPIPHAGEMAKKVAVHCRNLTTSVQVKNKSGTTVELLHLIALVLPFPNLDYFSASYNFCVGYAPIPLVFLSCKIRTKS